MDRIMMVGHMKRLVVLLLLLLAAPASAATPAAGRDLYNDGIAGKLLLDADWSIGPAADGPWKPVSVPHAANAGDLSDASFAGSVVFYRASFDMPAGTQAARWRLRFESVSETAEVWVNGTRVGAHEGAYVPFELDAPLRDGPNEVLVRVDWRKTADGLPGTRTFWWTWGGILREVYLRRVDRVDLEDVWAQATPRCERAATRCPSTVRVRSRLRNVTAAEQTVEVAPEIAGVALPVRTVEVPAGATRTVTHTYRQRSARLWRPADPALYTLAVRARVGGSAVAIWRSRFGVRRLHVRKGHLHLNGRRIRLYGSALHEESALDTGGALTPEQRERDQRLLQGLGARVIRSHYPLHPSVLEWADENGILVWDEIPAFRPTGEDLARPTYRANALRRLREMLVRDRSHPSVLAFSMGNEPIRPYPEDSVDVYVRDAVATIRRHAPGSLTAFALLGYEPPRRSMRALDLVGFNLYIGWYGRQTTAGIPARLRQIRAQWPDQATMVTEYGAEANRAGPADEKGTEAFQTALLRDSLRHYADDPDLSGAITWILRDFACAPGWAGGNPKPTPPLNYKGMVRADGAPKPSYAVMADLIERLNRRLLR